MRKVIFVNARESQILSGRFEVRSHTEREVIRIIRLDFLIAREKLEFLSRIRKRYVRSPTKFLLKVEVSEANVDLSYVENVRYAYTKMP